MRLPKICVFLLFFLKVETLLLRLNLQWSRQLGYPVVQHLTLAKVLELLEMKVHRQQLLFGLEMTQVFPIKAF
jgi:hypothetical protein